MVSVSTMSAISSPVTPPTLPQQPQRDHPRRKDSKTHPPLHHEHRKKHNSWPNQEGVVSCDGKLVYDRWLQQWMFIWVYEKERQLPHENQVVCSLDPGVRTFQTWYSPMHSCGEIGAKDARKLVRICLALDDPISRTRKAPAKKRNSMRRAQARMRQHVRNLVDEVHRKTALWLVKTFDAIIIPPFNSGEMGKKTRHRKIGSRTVRGMMTWAHARFRERLLSKAEEYGKKVFLVSEAYTSKTCSACGWINPKLGGKKVFSCRQCGLRIDRDVNGARGIFLRGMLDGVVELSGKQQLRYQRTLLTTSSFGHHIRLERVYAPVILPGFAGWSCPQGHQLALVWRRWLAMANVVYQCPTQSIRAGLSLNIWRA